MIFFITAAAALIISIFILRRPWDKIWARWAFAANMLLICIILTVFGSEYKIKSMRAIALRRTIIAALDVSASTGLTTEDFKDAAEKIWSDYSIEIIPFSDSINGAQDAESTAMIKSLKSILAYISGNYNDNDIAGFTVITDGNETERIRELNDKITPAGEFPHNVIYLDSDTGSGFVGFDKSVSFIKVPRFIPRYSKEMISFAVSATGAKLEGASVDLKLNSKNIGTVYISLKEGYGEGSFELITKQAGNNLLEASVAVDSREKITANNKDYAFIEGIHKGFRVLHISGHPSADTAFIRRGLQNIPGVDMISFYILRTNNQVFRTKDSELSLIPFPTDQLFREELDNFDLIIINDFKLTAFLNPYYINNIVKFAESGGGLLILGGPESFLKEDYLSNKFETILPVFGETGGGYDNGAYRLKQVNLSSLTPLSELNAIDKLKFTGLNKVRLKDWAVTFYSTESGLPVITGGIRNKARVLAVLTDSFWRFSYNAGLSNESALKSLIRYVLGISSLPVNIFNNSLNFSLKGRSFNDDVNARIQFLNYDGSIKKDIILKPSNFYNFSDTDSKLLDLSIEQNGKLIEKYRLINHQEKKWREHAYLPMGREYLKNFADKGNGKFIPADKSTVFSSLKELNLREPVVLSENKEEEIPIYEHKALLLLFLYLVIASFYLKSRYTG
ncbi:MAG: hypothetical protein V1874_13495 [Spirochaetota bacterium]